MEMKQSENQKQVTIGTLLLLAAETKAKFGDLVINPKTRELFVFQHQNCTEVAQLLCLTIPQLNCDGSFNPLGELKEGVESWVVCKHFGLLKAITFCGDCENLVACNDKSIRKYSRLEKEGDLPAMSGYNQLPTISKSFYPSFLERFNSGKQWNKVEVEIQGGFPETIDEVKNYDKTNKLPNNQIKLTRQNEVVLAYAPEVQINSKTHCPTCGIEATVQGDDKEGTHYYVPVKQEGGFTPDQVKALFEKLVVRGCFRGTESTQGRNYNIAVQTLKAETNIEY